MKHQKLITDLIADGFVATDHQNEYSVTLKKDKVTLKISTQKPKN